MPSGRIREHPAELSIVAAATVAHMAFADLFTRETPVRLSHAVMHASLLFKWHEYL